MENKAMIIMSKLGSDKSLSMDAYDLVLELQKYYTKIINNKCSHCDEGYVPLVDGHGYTNAFPCGYCNKEEGRKCF